MLAPNPPPKDEIQSLLLMLAARIGFLFFVVLIAIVFF